MALAPEELRRARASGGDVDELIGELRRGGLTVPDIEPLRGWDSDEDPTEDEGLVYELADACGAVRVNTIHTAGPEVDRPTVARRLAAVCDRAAAHGLTIAFEPRAHSAVDSPGAAARLVAAVGRPNLRVCLDAYHFHRAGHCADALDEIDPGLVGSLHLNDMRAVPRGSAVDDALDHRLVPGDGVIDLPGWLGELGRRGIGGAVSVEVLSSELRARPLPEAAALAHAGARRALDAAPPLR